MPAGTGAYTLTGMDVGLTAQRRLSIGAGTFNLAGQDVGLVSGDTAVETGDFVLNAPSTTITPSYLGSGTRAQGSGVTTLSPDIPASVNEFDLLTRPIVIYQCPGRGAPLLSVLIPASQ